MSMSILPLEPDTEFGFSYTLCILGALNTGKSSLLNLFCEDVYTQKPLATWGVDNKLCSAVFKNPLDEDVQAKISCFEVSGDERFVQMRKDNVRKSEVFVLVYSLSDLNSFFQLEPLIQEIRSNCQNREAPIFIVGNKCDGESVRLVTLEQAEGLAGLYGLLHFEVSAKTQHNIGSLTSALTRCFQRLSFPPFSNEIHFIDSEYDDVIKQLQAQIAKGITSHDDLASFKRNLSQLPTQISYSVLMIGGLVLLCGVGLLLSSTFGLAGVGMAKSFAAGYQVLLLIAGAALVAGASVVCAYGSVTDSVLVKQFKQLIPKAEKQLSCVVPGTISSRTP